MPFNGAGQFTPSAADNPVVAATLIQSTKFNNTINDIATGLSTCLTKDGQQIAAANQPMGGFRHTNVANAANRNEYAAVGQVQDQAFSWCGTAGGTADALTLTPTPAITTYAAGQVFIAKAGGSPNTGAATVAVSGLVAKALQNDGGALTAGDIAAGKWYTFTYDGAAFQINRLISAGSTITGTNVWTGNNSFVDSGFRVIGSGDATKKVAFEVDGLTTGTMRTLTVQDSSDTLVGRATTDTLTNKTLTTPTLNGALAGTSLATNAETLAGADATKIVTPAGLASQRGLVTLSSGAASGATLDIVMTTFTAFRNKLLVVNLIPATDAVDLRLRVSTDGGASYDAGAAAYAWNVTGLAAASVFNEGSVGDTFIRLNLNAAAANPIGNAATEGCNFEIILWDTINTARWPTCTWNGMHTASDASSRLVTSFGGGQRGLAQDTDAIRLLFSAGNIASGNWVLYGWN